MATKRISDLQLRSNFDDTVNLPGDDASQTWRVTGSQIKTYIQTYVADLMKQARDLYNLGLSASVSGSALTIALKQLDGSTDPTAASPVKIGFRGTTAGNGDSSLVSVAAALSTVISSGSTAGFTSAIAGNIYVYALNNGGTVELAWAGCPFDENSLQSTTAEGGAGAADSGTVLYSTTARTSKAIRLIGILTATETTAGTWATAPSQVEVASRNSPVRAPTFQRFTSGSGTYTLPTPAPLYLKVRMQGGGGGGAGSGTTTSGNNGSNGGDTSFSVSYVAGQGQGGSKNSSGTSGAGGTGGTNTTGTYTSWAVAGGDGGRNAVTSGVVSSSPGGVSMQGGSGNIDGTGTGPAAKTNSGSGGSGGAGNQTSTIGAGGGGGAGAYQELFIPSPSVNGFTSVAYAVGASGGGGSLGTSGSAGGAGGSGQLIVEEYYQ